MTWTNARTSALATLLALAPACGGKLTTGVTPEPPPDASDEAPGAIDAAVPSFDASAPAVPDASPYPVACGTKCPASTYLVEWVSPDGGVERCECAPLSDGHCSPIDSPTADCSCTICEGRTLTCSYDPYYGNVTEVVCKGP